MDKMRVMTVVGTRPEIIRLSQIIKKLDENFDHTLVHTGQNYDYELNEIFFEELGLRKPDIFLKGFNEYQANLAALAAAREGDAPANILHNSSSWLCCL